MEFLSIRRSFYLINEMRALVKYKEWRLCILYMNNNFCDQLNVMFINHLSPCWHLLKAKSTSAYGTDDCCLCLQRLAVGPTQLVVCPLTIWSRLNYCWVSCGLLPIFWGHFNLAYKDYWPITWVHWLKRVGPFWLWIYNWSTEWSIAFKEII